MRYAVVVAPPCFTLPPEGNVFRAPEPVGPLCAALARGGRRVLLVPFTSGLEVDLEQALAEIGEGLDLVIYAALTVAASRDGVAEGSDPASRAAVNLSALGDAVAAKRPCAALFIIEAIYDLDAEAPERAVREAEAIEGALSARSRGYGALIGVRLAPRGAPAEWPFTRRVLDALAAPGARDGQGWATMSLVCALLGKDKRHDPPEFGVTLLPGSEEIAIVEPPVPPPRATEPSLPALEPLLDLADAALARGALAEALAGYKAALLAVPQADRRARAPIYARIGGLKRIQAKPREAELNFEKALAVDTQHRGALDALIELATESQEVRRAVELRRKRLDLLVEPDEKVAELCAIAETCSLRLHDPRTARETLDQALALDGKGRTALENLRGAYEKVGGWQGVVEVVSLLADSEADSTQRSALRFAAAELALARLKDERRGLELLEQAVEDDATNDGALGRLVDWRTQRGEYEAIASRYVGLIARYAAVGDTDRAWDTCSKLGALRRDKLRDPAGAVDALSGAVACQPHNVESRALLAEARLAAGDEAGAVAEFERLAQRAPTRSETYDRILSIHQRAGRTDRAWLVATVLAELGCADLDQDLLVDQYRPDGPIRPARPINEAGWNELLRAPGADDNVSAILRAIVATAAALRIDELRQARKLPSLDPARRQSATSTVSVVRSFHWAAHVLGVEGPDLYVMDDVPGGIAAIHAPVPSTALGPEVLRGLNTKDLAFLAGRHLTYYRPENYALICHPTLDDLSVLFLAALKIVLPDVEAPAQLREGVARKHGALAKQATDDEKRSLRRAVELLQAAGGRADLAAWIRSVELAAQRAGLLLCGDLAVAMARLRAEIGTRTIAELTFDDKRDDLLAFCASEKLAGARAWLGVELRCESAVPRSDAPGELQAG